VAVVVQLLPVQMEQVPPEEMVVPVLHRLYRGQALPIQAVVVLLVLMVGPQERVVQAAEEMEPITIQQPLLEPLEQAVVVAVVDTPALAVSAVQAAPVSSS
jgi:hypothetical protein